MSVRSVSHAGVTRVVGISTPTVAPQPAGREDWCAARGVRRVLDEPAFQSAASRVRSEMAEHDAANESADLLEQLAATRSRVGRMDAVRP